MHAGNKRPLSPQYLAEAYRELTGQNLSDLPEGRTVWVPDGRKLRQLSAEERFQRLMGRYFGDVFRSKLAWYEARTGETIDAQEVLKGRSLVSDREFIVGVLSDIDDYIIAGYQAWEERNRPLSERFEDLLNAAPQLRSILRWYSTFHGRDLTRTEEFLAITQGHQKWDREAFAARLQRFLEDKLLRLPEWPTHRELLYGRLVRLVDQFPADHPAYRHLMAAHYAAWDEEWKDKSQETIAVPLFLDDVEDEERYNFENYRYNLEAALVDAHYAHELGQEFGTPGTYDSVNDAYEARLLAYDRVDEDYDDHG